MYKQILNYLNEDKMTNTVLVNDAVKNTGLLPVEYSNREERQDVILMDINLLPSEYKEGVLKDAIKQYEKDFNVKLIPYDSSRQNTNGAVNTLIQYLGRE